jgi:hypothetical protein
MIAAKKCLAHPGLATLGMESAGNQLRLAALLFPWIVVRRLDESCRKQNTVEELQLRDVTGPDHLRFVRTLVSYPRCISKIAENGMAEFTKILDDAYVQHTLNVNTYNGTAFFSKERFEELMVLFLVSVLMENLELTEGNNANKEAREQYVNAVTLLVVTAERSGYQLQKFRELLMSSPAGNHKKIPL